MSVTWRGALSKLWLKSLKSQSVMDWLCAEPRSKAHSRNRTKNNPLLGGCTKTNGKRSRWRKNSEMRMNPPVVAGWKLVQNVQSFNIKVLSAGMWWTLGEKEKQLWAKLSPEMQRAPSCLNASNHAGDEKIWHCVSGATAVSTPPDDYKPHLCLSLANTRIPMSPSVQKKSDNTKKPQC